VDADSKDMHLWKAQSGAVSSRRTDTEGRLVSAGASSDMRTGAEKRRDGQDTRTSQSADVNVPNAYHWE
jgi:hypothetical protein